MNYKYDALGRMLYRGESNGTTVTVNYWLGLAPLATEQWGSESGRNLAIFQPWIEAHAGPTSDGWYVYGGSGTKTLEYAIDAGRGEVLHITTTSGGALDAQFIVGDKNGSNYNPNATDWSNANRKHLAFWVKNSNTSNHFQFTVYCRFSSGDNILLFDSGTGSDASSAGTSTFYLGSAYSTLNDGGWHYVELDLQAYQRIFSGSGSLNDVDGLRFDCKNLYLDDPVLSGGALKRTYAVVLGAAICGALGSWTGPNVVKDNGNAVRYFQYNDLGTVMAQTKADGTVEGAWEPDFYGNYENRQMLSGSPAWPELGLTGQIYDPATGSYTFRNRINDPERGRWMSEEPSGKSEGMNLYEFTESDPFDFYDPDGLHPWGHHKIPKVIFKYARESLKRIFNNVKYRIDDTRYVKGNGPAHDSKEYNGVGRNKYTDAVKGKLDDFVKSKGKTCLDDLTDSEATEFADMINGIEDGDIGLYNAGVQAEMDAAISAAKAAEAASAALRSAVVRFMEYGELPIEGGFPLGPDPEIEIEPPLFFDI